MSVHTLVVVVRGRRFDQIENVVVPLVQRYCNWSIEKAREAVDGARVTCRPVERRHGVVWEATVEVDV